MRITEDASYSLLRPETIRSKNIEPVDYVRLIFQFFDKFCLKPAAVLRFDIRTGHVRAYRKYLGGFSSDRLYYIGAAQGPAKQTISKKKKRGKCHGTFLESRLLFIVAQQGKTTRYTRAI